MNKEAPVESTFDADTIGEAVEETGHMIEPSAPPAAYTAALTRPVAPTADKEMDISPVSDGRVEKMYQW
jgi:hypothetical protein